jgi:predicted small secreted protein
MNKKSILNRSLLLALLLLLGLLLSACSNNNTVTGSSDATQSASALPSIQIDTNSTSTPVKAATTATPLPSPTPAPTPKPTPTLSGPLEPVDKAYELDMVKKAYDSINNHLFKEPDNSRILAASLVELGNISGIKVKIPEFSGTKEEQWQTFSDTFNLTLEGLKLFNWQYPKGELAHRMITEMAEAVGDGHTYFMNKSAAQNRQNLFSGNNSQVGFGIVPVFYNDNVYLSRVILSAPAGKAGLQAGDQLVAYDDQPLNSKNWQIVREAKENESHKFTIKRLGEPKLLEINVVKGRYNMPVVEYRMINGNIGYIAIRDFFKNVTGEFATVHFYNQSKEKGIKATGIGIE